MDVPLRELLRLSVEESDGTASDVLLRVLGGKAKAQAYLSGLGVEGIRIETTEGEMGRDSEGAVPELGLARRRRRGGWPRSSRARA